MGIINILDKQTANLIAAGEVVERPSSAIKEMLENCADAGAQNVTVEIKNGGTTYIRITDDGKGMSKEDVPKAIMRHATSKIKSGADLEAIGTYGFRGEALAAISAVSRVRILTARKGDESGTLFECDFGEQKTLEDAGCPNGTTITVENIFENVPARRKFLKKDSTEALSVLTACEKFALSRPDIALTLISDNNVKMQTPGDGDLKSAIYSTLGRDFASSLLKVNYSFSDITIHGYIGKPEYCRPNRNMQNFFVNNRYIRSRTMLAAIEEGFRGFCPTGKFPACVLFCDIDLRLVDVNVHPAKLEIKFSDERKIFDSVYFAVKNALSSGVTFAQFEEGQVPAKQEQTPEKQTEKPFPQSTAKPVEKEQPTVQNEKTQPTVQTENKAASSIFHSSMSNVSGKVIEKQSQAIYVPDISNAPDFPVKPKVTEELSQKVYGKYTKESMETQNSDKTATEKKPTEIKITEITPTPPLVKQEQVKPQSPVIQKQENLQIQTQFPQEKVRQKPIYIGEAFDTYIVVQNKSSLYLIDKHAAHERIIYERLKNPDYTHSSQFLLEGINVFLTPKEAGAVRDNKSYFENIGFEFDEFGEDSFLIRAIPLPLSQTNVKDVFTYLAGKLSEGNSRSAGEIFDRALFTAACRAAIKGGDKHTDIDNKLIIDEVFNNDAVLYCPHGRPVILEFTREKLEKMFDRT